MMRFSENSPENLFRRLDKSHRHAFDAALLANDLAELGNPYLLVVLAHKGKNGVMDSQRELAERMNVSPSTITVSLKSLERQGYVKKLSDERDMRRKPIAITAKGSAAIKKIDNVYADIDSSMYSGFSEKERAQISDYFVRMIDNLNKQKGKYSEGDESSL